MPNAPASRVSLEQALAPHGLRVLGGLVPDAADALPMLPGGRTAEVIWMVGQVGSECWSAFASSPFYSDGLPNPMDRWAMVIGERLAQQSGGIALYPSDGPPFYPFQQWGKRAGPVQTSPLMLQIHPQHGLWHAYRFALALPDLLADDAHAITRNAAIPNPDLCLNCAGQPCLSACPAGAFTGAAYEIDRCSGHLHGPQGNTCMPVGCQARHACPEGTAYRYRPEHAAFHMAAFAARH